MSLYKAQDLAIGYDHVLQDNLNFEIQAGDFLHIVGSNGKGKSTLLKTLMGKIPKLSGQIETSLEEKDWSYLPQLAKGTLILSVTLDEMLQAYNVPERVKSVLSKDVLEKRWVDASGGERQKALILSRLASGSKVLFLDEPFNHLDRSVTNELIEFFNELIRSQFVSAIVMVGHIFPEKLSESDVVTLELQ